MFYFVVPFTRKTPNNDVLVENRFVIKFKKSTTTTAFTFFKSV
jgi:hypothetical protein